MQAQVQLRCEDQLLTNSSPIIQLQSDRELIDQYLGGNEECMSVLVNRHKSKLFTFIMNRTYGNFTYSEDVFQETFVKAIHSIKSGKYREQDKFVNWLMRIARNLIIDNARRNQRVRWISTVKNADGEKEDIFNVIDVGEKISIRHFEKRQAHRKIRHLIKRLPKEQMQVLILREYFDMSFKEISKFRRVNVNTALCRMRYALIALRRMIAKERLTGTDFL